MSVQDIINNSVTKTSITMNFAAPGALNTAVTGTESELGESKFVLQQSNIITNISNVLDPAAGLNYQLFTKRLNNITKFLGATAAFLATFNGQQRPGMPIGIARGSFIFSEIQTAGALTLQDYTVTTVRPLAV